MDYYDITLPKESAWEFIEQIGKMKIAHFMDCNLDTPANQRHSQQGLFQCNQIEDKLNQIERICLKFDKKIIYSKHSEFVLDYISQHLKEREEK